MLRGTDPVITQAVDAIYVMSKDEKIREAVRLREKRLHDEASALRSAKLEGRAEGRAEILKQMKLLGFPQKQIDRLSE